MSDVKSIGDVPEGLYARIPIAELSLAEAADQVEDASFWYDTRVPILYHFPQIRVDEYWQLTVVDHRDFYDWLVAEGLWHGV